MTEGEGDRRKRIPERPRDLAALFEQNTTDDQATAEAKQLSQGKSEEQLRDDAKAAEAERTEKFRDHFERLAIISLYVVWIAIAIIGVLWVYHTVAPPNWWRLPDDQVRNLQAIVTGGVIAGTASGHLKRRLAD